jgi:hypothetical protein
MHRFLFPGLCGTAVTRTLHPKPQFNITTHDKYPNSMRLCSLLSPTQRSQLVLLQATPPNSINFTESHSHGALALCLYSDYMSACFPVYSGVGLRPFAFWDCGLEFRRGHACLSLVNVVRCQVEVSATGRSFIQDSPTESGVCVRACARH